MSAITYNTKPESRFVEKASFGLILTVWFGLAAAAGMTEILTAGPEALVRPILLSVALPVAAFLALYFGSSRFQTYVLTRDIRFLTMLQSWRVLGFTFLMLYAWGTLPGLFDFVVAAGTAMLTAGGFPSLISGSLTSAPMEIWPLNLFPSFGVPIFIILHLTVLFQVMKLRREM